MKFMRTIAAALTITITAGVFSTFPAIAKAEDEHNEADVFHQCIAWDFMPDKAEMPEEITPKEPDIPKAGAPEPESVEPVAAATPDAVMPTAPAVPTVNEQEEEESFLTTLSVANLPADGVCGEGVTWQLDTDGTLTISGGGAMYDADTADEIPWNEYKSDINRVVISEGVTSISSYAFRACYNLAEVVVAESVEHIGEYAFAYCTSLESITLPHTVTAISSHMFYGCTKLDDVTINGEITEIGARAFASCESITEFDIPQSVTVVGDYAFASCYGLEDVVVHGTDAALGDYVFYNCKNLKSAEICEGVVSIGTHAFDKCANITDVVLPESLEGIADYAFYGCKSLEDITIPDGVTFIGESAFRECVKLESIEIPNSVERIGNYAFYGCAGLKSADISGSVRKVGIYIFMDCTELEAVSIKQGFAVIGEGMFLNCESLNEIDLPEGIESIEAYAFSNTGIKNAVIPESVRNIGVYAFYGCAALETLEIKGTVKEIGEQAFIDCDKLKAITMAGVGSIDDYAFYGCKSLVNLTINGLVERIGQSAFAHCDNLESVETGSTGVIGDYAFYECKRLNDVTVNGDVSKIGAYAFYKCINLASVSVAGAAEVIGDFAFYDCNKLSSFEIAGTTREIGNCAFVRCYGLTSFKLTESLRSIGVRAFEGCSGITEIDIPSSQTEIYSYAFYGCDGLTEIIIPEGVRKIGKFAFAECVKLESVVIPQSVHKIESGAFSGCDSLQSVILPDTLIEIGDYAFYSCGNLVSAYVPSGITELGDNIFMDCVSLDDVTLAGGMSKLGNGMFDGCESLTDIEIPDSVTFIGERAFADTGLTSVTIPDSVAATGAAVFYGCQKLADVSLNNTVTALESFLFRDCTALKEIVIPECVTTIKDYVFAGSGLVNISVPAAVTEISDCVFKDCTNLSEISLPELKRIGAGAFWGCTALKSIMIPKTVTEIERDTFKESGLESISIHDGVTAIREHAFEGCKSLTAAELGSGLRLIGGYAFAESGLKSVIIPDSVNEIGAHAFENCEALKSISLSENIKEIKEYTFKGCAALSDIVLPYFVNAVGNYAFADCASLMSVSIYDEMSSMAANAFNNHNNELTILCFPETYAEEYAKAHNIRYADLMGGTVRLAVFGENGLDITDSVRVRWYKKGSSEILSENAVFLGYDNEQDYEFEITPLGEQAYKYYQSGRQLLTAQKRDEEYYAEYTMAEIKDIKLTGAVVNKAGKPVEGVLVTATQTFGRDAVNQITAVTDKAGKYSVTVKDVPTSASYSAEEYYTVTLDVISSPTGASEYKVSAVTLESVPENKIKLSMGIRSAAKTGETGAVKSITSFANLSVSAYNITRGKELSYSLQYPSIYPREGEISAGDRVRITIHDENHKMEDASAEVVIGEDLSADASVIFTENGRFEAAVNKRTAALVFDSAGAFVDKYTSDSVITGGNLASGTYKVVFIENNGYLSKVSSLSKLNELGLQAGGDYAEKDVLIENGVITSLGNIDVPKLDVSKLYYTIDDETYCTVNKSTASVGEFISVRVKYEINPKYTTSEQKVSIELPDGLNYVGGSLTVDGAKRDFSVSGGTLETTVNKPSATVRFYVMADAAASYNISSYLTFKSEGVQLIQPIGTASTEVSAVSLTVPSKTGRTDVTVSGQAIAKSTVNIFDNGVAVAQTTSNAAGSWSVQYVLNAPGDRSEHSIYAEIETRYGVKYQSTVHELEYDKDFCEVERVTMINTAHGPSNLDPLEVRTVFEFLEPDTSKHAYDYYPKYPDFTFVVELTGNSVEEVQVMTTDAAGNVTYVSCEYDAPSGNWIGTHSYNNYTDTPVGIAATFVQAGASVHRIYGTGRDAELAGTDYSYAPKANDAYNAGAGDGEFIAKSVYPQKGGAGKVTVRIEGNMLEANLIAALTNGSKAYAAEKIYWFDAHKAYATFDLSDAPDGTYSLNISCGEKTHTLSNCFTVNSGLHKGELSLDINVDTNVTVGKEYKGSITVGNTGYTDVYAPVIELTGSNLQFKTEDGEYTDNSKVFVQNYEGLAGIIASGETASYNFTYKTGQDGNFALTVDDYTAKGGNLYGDVLLNANSDKSDILTYNMLELMGKTYREYAESIAEMANALDPTTKDITAELAESVYQTNALGSLGGSVVESAYDLVSTDLSVARDYGNTSYRKTESGMFGIGWSGGYDLTAEYVNEDGTEGIVVYGGGISAIFVKNEDGVFVNALSETNTAELGSDGSITLNYKSGDKLYFDAEGRMVKSENIYGDHVDYGYSNGKMVSVSNSYGDKIEFTYSGGKVISASAVTGDTVQYAYDGDYLTAVTTKYGTTRYSYDTTSFGAKRNTLTKITYPDGTYIGYSYDTLGRVTKGTNGEYTVSYTYGINEITAADNMGNTTRTMYNAVGSPVWAIDATGGVSYVEYEDYLYANTIKSGLTKSVQYEYDENGLPVKITTPGGRETRYEYDSFGGISGVTDPGGVVTKYNRNENGDTEAIVYADGSSNTYEYNGKGQISSAVTRGGRKASYEYDNKGNLVQKRFSSGERILYTYDTKGKLTSIAENGEITKLEYNEKGDITKVTYPNGRSLSYGYDDLGRQISFTDNEGNVTRYVYDSQSRVSSITDGDDSVITEYAYNRDGTLAKQTNANGTYTEYSYSKGILSAIKNYSASGGVLSSFEYTYDEYGNISTMTDTDGEWKYSYDDIGQLIKAEAPNGSVTEYSYDASGNRQSVSVNGKKTEYVANGINQYTKYGNTQLSYDADGNLISETNAEGTTYYEWDYRGRLSKMTTASGHVYEYGYDAFGNRSSVSIDGAKTEYLNDPTGDGYAVAAYSKNDVTRYILAGSIAAQESGGEMYFYNSNHLGSVTELTGEDGAVVNRYRYDHEGNVTFKTEQIKNPFTYVGIYGIADDGNGLYYDRARYISAATDSFLSPDPAGQYYDLNEYRYAYNNPIRYIDISGKAGEVPPVGGPQPGGDYPRNPYPKNPQEGNISPGDPGTEGESIFGGGFGGEPGDIYGSEADFIEIPRAPKTTWWDGVGGWFGGIGQWIGDHRGAIITGLTVALAIAIAIGVIMTLPADIVIGAIATLGAGLATMAPAFAETPEEECNHPPGCTCGNCINCVKGAQPKPDPSGYVYGGAISNRIEGVTATIYYEGYKNDEFGEPDIDAGLQTLEWTDAADYDEVNPQLTDVYGRYGWDVIEGRWIVKFTKDGYKETWSEWMDVPPEYTDVNINLDTLIAPNVKSVNIYDTEVQIIFDQYMDIDSVNNATVTVTAGGKAVAGTIRAANAEYNFENTAQYASIFKFIPSSPLSGNVTVSVLGVKNYSGIALDSAHTASGAAEIKPQGIEIAGDTSVEQGGQTELILRILPAGAGANKNIKVKSYSPSIAEVNTETVTTGSDGTARVSISGKISGAAVMTASIEGTDISAEFMVLVGKAADSKKPVTVTARERYDTDNVLIAALYDDGGTMLECQIRNPNGTGTDVFEFKYNPQASYVKLMEWESLTGMKPAAGAEFETVE